MEKLQVFEMEYIHDEKLKAHVFSFLTRMTTWTRNKIESDTQM